MGIKGVVMKTDIFGMSYSVSLVDGISPYLRKGDEMLAGVIYYDVKNIYINKQISYGQQVETFVHELTHAILYESQLDVTKDSYTEEELCRFTERFLPLINDKKDEFEKYLKENKEK